MYLDAGEYERHIRVHFGSRASQEARPLEFHPIALDAGTEVNDESGANIPGPCCKHPFSGIDEEGGVVLGSPGIAGVGDLPPAHDWRGPVAAVVVTRQ